MNDKPINTLLIEDSPGDARLIEEMLAEFKDAQFNLTCLDRLSTALDYLSRKDIDIALLDLSLPDSQGIETFTKFQIKAQQVPVIVLTGLNDEVMAVKALREGAQDYLVKGQIDKNLLVRAVRYAIERKGIEQQLKEYSDNLEQLVEERTRELKNTHQKLVRTEKLAAIGELAGSIAHELRNPLGAVKASTYYIKMRLEGTADDKLIKHLGLLEKQTTICANIISDLLDFSGPSKLDIGTVDLDHVIRELVKNTELPRNVEILTNLAGNLAPVIADRGRLERVLSNLISNAIDAMPDGGKLYLNTNQNSGFVEVIVKDTGMGIPKENLDKIFEPLFTTKAKGVGLGLSLTKALVEKQDGTIDVQSQIGEGTTFSIKFSIIGDK